jgi:tRNA dimethylallyltransferase
MVDGKQNGAIPPLVVVVGETASGKTALGIELAKKFNGEIICADSRTVYKGMDVGTAKPTKKEQEGVPHHLLDIVEPNEKYNAARFQKDANALINDISDRGKLSIMVGGTGLYVDSVIFEYDFDKKTMSELRPNTLVIGMKREREELLQRIEQRIDVMLKQGLVEEVQWVGEQYGWDVEAMTGIGYRAFADYIKGEKTLDEARQDFIRGDKLLAKRQRTWFKRNKSIHWIEGYHGAISLVAKWLQTNDFE